MGFLTQQTIERYVAHEINDSSRAEIILKSFSALRPYQQCV